MPFITYVFTDVKKPLPASENIQNGSHFSFLILLSIKQLVNQFVRFISCVLNFVNGVWSSIGPCKQTQIEIFAVDVVAYLLWLVQAT